MKRAKITKQVIFWESKQGDKYTDRNPQSVAELNALYRHQYGVSRTAMNRNFLSGLSHSLRILEVGANIGLQLAAMRKIGFKNSVGIDINGHAIKQAKKIHPDIDIIKGSAFDIPFRDGYFDLVFTSGVLIHISPKDIHTALKEIIRVSNRYIWGLEYFAPRHTDVVYRGKKDFLWKGDFPALYSRVFPKIKTVKEEKYPMRGTEDVSQMFLLKK